MSDAGATLEKLEKLEKQIKLLAKKLERSERYRAEQEDMRARDQSLHRRLQSEVEEARREVEIEAALERVRSRALAMNTSDELLDVVCRIHQEFVGLGLPCENFWQTAHGPEYDRMAVTTVGGSKVSAIIEVPRDSAVAPDLHAWERSEEKIGVFKFESDAGRQYLHDMVTKGRFLEGESEGVIAETLREPAGFTFVKARTSHGEIAYSLAGQTDPSEEAKDVLVRFTSTFDLAYRRFLDIQQAEADHKALLKEKALTEKALEDLRATQQQLIQSEKLASLGALTAGIAHEIKNPLNFVNNFAGVSQELIDELDSEEDPEERAALLADLKTNAAMIQEHGQRADSIVRAMMDHARTGTGERSLVELNALVKEYLSLAHHGMRARHPDFDATVEQSFGEDVGEVTVVAQEIGRALVNLLDNAFDAVRQHATTVEGAYEPSVSVVTLRNAKTVEVRVQDNGAGMPDSVREKVFEPFFTTKPTGEGTGLGLSMSYDIVTKGHGGTLTVESQPGAGSTFVVQLPV